MGMDGRNNPSILKQSMNHRMKEEQLELSRCQMFHIISRVNDAHAA